MTQRNVLWPVCVSEASSAPCPVVLSHVISKEMESNPRMPNTNVREVSHLPCDRADCFLGLMASLLLLMVLAYGLIPPLLTSPDQHAARVNQLSGHQVEQSSLPHSTDPVPPDNPGKADQPGDTVVVNTRYGPIRGLVKDGVQVFLGVPFAKPPTGSLRWMYPTDPTPWKPKIIDATRSRPGCPQQCSFRFYCSSQMSEDCLYLRIYGPENVSSPRPVMVYFHGGSFKDASSTLSIFDATKLVQRSRLVVVLVEFRIGSLGFLVTGQGNADAKGNYGLADQRQALDFISKNIGSFGGDPNQVTIAGQSSGALSVLIHLVSNLSSQYFRFAMLMSAPVVVPYKTQTAASSLGRSLATILNCTDGADAVDMSCLRNKTFEEIVAAEKKSSSADQTIVDKIISWGPVIDQNYVQAQTLDALEDYTSNASQVKPLLCGYTADEGFMFVKGLFPGSIPTLVYFLVLGLAFKDARQEVKRLYPVTNSSDSSQQLADIISDLVFRCPLNQVAQRAGQNIYLYLWATPPDTSPPEELASACTGRTCHSAEVPYMFHTFHTFSNSTNPKDLNLSNKFTDYLTNFITFGNPNGQVEEDPGQKLGQSNSGNGSTTTSASVLPVWPSVTTEGKEGLSYLWLSPDGQVTGRTDRDDPKCQLWNRIGYKVLQQLKIPVRQLGKRRMPILTKIRDKS